MKKFEYIYKDIKDKIESGEHKVGSFLPKENDLAEYYQVSRETLRKAQRILEDEGFIRKIHGQGAKVLDFTKLEISSNNITNFSKLSGRHSGLKTKLLKRKTEFLKVNDFGYDDVKDQPGISIERLRLLNDQAVILDKDFFLVSEVGVDIPEEYLFSSTYAYFENIRGLKIGFAQKDITIEKPDKELRLALDLGDDTHVAVTRSKVFLDNATLFQIHEAYQRVDTFHLFDLAKR